MDDLFVAIPLLAPSSSSSRGQELHCRIHGISLATTLPRHGAIDGQRLGLRTAIAWGLANGRAPCFNWFIVELNYIVLSQRGAITTKIRYSNKTVLFLMYEMDIQKYSKTYRIVWCFGKHGCRHNVCGYKIFKKTKHRLTNTGHTLISPSS